MQKLWAARFSKDLDKIANDFNSSISVDSLMYEQDILGSIAHATMLGAQGIIAQVDADSLIVGLECILVDINTGKLQIDVTAEDIHMFIETELTARLGVVGKCLHTARSRNDQVALDTRMYVAKKIEDIINMVKGLTEAIIVQAKSHTKTIMPGYTHLQRAQPITFASHLLAYANMLLRDIDRLEYCKSTTMISPLGSCALAGTTYPIDRQMVSSRLGFKGVCASSLDGVSDRDFLIELASDIAILMMHLSRFSEEIILWCSWEFKFIELDDSYSTGSSIMPQKKNPDMAELVRGKTGRVYGNLMAILTVMKGLPLAYNKDMQEDKSIVFDSIETALVCVEVFTGMLQTIKVNADNMLKAGEKGFINATDCADYLVKKGIPFRESYKIVGELVAYCVANRTTLNDLSMEVYKSKSPLFEEDIYVEIDLLTCVSKRNSEGGVSPQAVEEQLAKLIKIMEA